MKTKGEVSSDILSELAGYLTKLDRAVQASGTSESNEVIEVVQRAATALNGVSQTENNKEGLNRGKAFIEDLRFEGLSLFSDE